MLASLHTNSGGHCASSLLISIPAVVPDYVMMMVMEVNGPGVASTVLGDAHDIFASASVHKRQSTILLGVIQLERDWPYCLSSSFRLFNAHSSVCSCLCVFQHQAVLSASLFCADSRYHHNLR